MVRITSLTNANSLVLVCLTLKELRDGEESQLLKHKNMSILFYFVQSINPRFFSQRHRASFRVACQSTHARAARRRAAPPTPSYKCSRRGRPLYTRNSLGDFNPSHAYMTVHNAKVQITSYGHIHGVTNFTAHEKNGDCGSQGQAKVGSALPRHLFAHSRKSSDWRTNRYTT